VILEGIKVGNYNYQLVCCSLLQYNFFLCKAKLKTILVIKSTLIRFELASGLKFNFHKSKLGSIGIKYRMIKRFVTILNCNITDIRFTYRHKTLG